MFSFFNNKKSDPETKKDSWCIITPRATRFVALLLERGLTKYFPMVVVLHEMPQEFTDFDHYIVLCAQVQKRLPPPEKTIIFQLEQCTSDRWWTEEYLSQLKSVYAVFDYSLANISFMERRGVSFPKVYYIPIGGIPNYRPDLPTVPDDEKQSDFLFYGNLLSSDRRRKLLIPLTSHPDHKVCMIDGIYGDDLYKQIKASKAVLNLHFYRPSILETTRIMECLSLGIPVLSEQSINSKEYPEMDSGIMYFNEDSHEDLSIKAELMAKSPITKKEIDLAVEKSFSRFQFMLDRFLMDQNLISLDNIKQVDIESDRVVLSLAESTIRRTSFFTQPLKKVEVFDGIRYKTGWIGCALSYKLLAQAALKNKFTRFTVMEDDVEVPPEFESRLAMINRYLDKQTDWDLFSGFIADIHPDTKISKIENFEGTLFITIDKMTSTVFNIYSQSGLKLLSEWNPENRDVSNTIDRYMESQKKLKVILTYPYFVGHKEELSSTVWGFKNTQYQEMLKKSNTTLRSKIEEYFKNRP